MRRRRAVATHVSVGAPHVLPDPSFTDPEHNAADSTAVITGGVFGTGASAPTLATTSIMPLPSHTLSVRDRTTEFTNVLASARAARGGALAAKVGTGGDTNGGAANSGVLMSTRTGLNGTTGQVKTPRSDFARLAAQVSADIAGTSVKLSKLTSLAQRKSLFDDPTAEIQELTFVIKQDLGALNARLEDLQRLRDATRRSANKQTGDHSENVVESLRTRLGTTAEGFKSVLKLRTESLAAQQDRRSQFMTSSASAPFAPRPSAFAPAHANNAALDLGSGSLGASQRSTLAPSAPHQHGQALTLARPVHDVSYQQARADAVRQVESTIVELGDIFNQLATMVSEQGEMVDRIDANVEETVSNMNAGHNQLITYYNSISGNRALVMKVFGVLLAFLVLWSVVL